MRSELFQQYLARARGVLHLGAHLGQEAELYASHGKNVIWVEALPHIHARLAERLASFTGQRAICALLDREDGTERVFHISNNGEGVSSSLFPFGEYGSGEKTLWPDLNLSMVAQLTLPTVRLDSLLKRQAIDPSRFDLWIVDLQGAELIVLQGAEDALAHCQALYCEVSMVEVYHGGAKWAELCEWLDRAGFEPLWVPEHGHDDVLFVRRQPSSAIATFHSEGYLRHNQRRLEHLATLCLDLRDKEVLEVGAGIGDHTSFYLDRGCRVVSTDGRPENVAAMEQRFAGNKRVEVRQLDLEHPIPLGRDFEVIHCYGLLYHLENPQMALTYLATHCHGILVLETCVSRESVEAVNPLTEPANDFSQALYGRGCRPTRPWVWNALNGLFPFVYSTRTQPCHEEFPVDWTAGEIGEGGLIRSVFVASRTPLADNANLLDYLPSRQVYY